MANDQESFEAADRFLRPVLGKGSLARGSGQSLVKVLSPEIAGSNTEEHVKADIVINKALSLLEDIDRAIASSNVGVEHLFDTNQRRLVDALLDLILLEGICPYLSPGVGVPIEQRVRSIFQSGFVASPQRDISPASSNFVSIILRLSKLATNGSKPVSSEVLDRNLVDLVAVRAQLSFEAGKQAIDGDWSAAGWSDFLARISTARLFNCLTHLLHPAAPAWLRSCLATERSLLPMRPDGVRQTILFMSRSIPLASSGEPSSSKEVGLSQSALDQASRLLSSVPSTVSTQQYFAAIAPQLLDLLDDTDENMSHAASHIISQGILNRRATGAPGTVGWKLLVDLLLEAIKPTTPTKEQSAKNHPESSESIATALRRLSRVLSIPNPGLVKRLMTPLLLPTWAIMNEAAKGSEERKLCSLLLHGYVGGVAGTADLLRIADNLCWDGQNGWKYHLDSNRHVTIDRLSERTSTVDILQTMMQVVPSRVKYFVQLLEKSAANKDIVTVFMYVLRRWLLGNNLSKFPGNDDSTSDVLVQRYVDAQIAQGLIMQQKSWLVAEPSQMIDLCNELLNGSISSYETRQVSQKQDTPSMASIASIVRSNPTDVSPFEDSEDSEETISVSLALLTNLLNDSNFETVSVPRADLNELKSSLLPISQRSSLSSSSRSSAKALLSILKHMLEDDPTSEPATPRSLDSDLYTKAMNELTAPEPHVRAQAISSIETLIQGRSSVISAAPLTITLLSLVQDQESFVYLPAIRALASLARLDAMAVMKQLIEAYEDRLEASSVDVRLRVGEALQSVLDDIGHELPRAAVQRSSQMMLRMAGRRVIRLKAEKTWKAKRVAREQRRKDVGLDPNEAPAELSESGSDTEDLRTQLRAAALLEGWQGKGGEEDVRIRASSLSLLSTIVEQCILSAIGSTIPQFIEVTNGVLTKESGEDKVILRRAAVLGFMSILKALDNVGTPGMMPGFRDEGMSLDDITKLLERLKVEDEDELVRGHAESVLERLDAWRENRLQRMIAGEDIRFGLEENGTLKGINSNVDKSSRESSRKPKIEEVE